MDQNECFITTKWKDFTITTKSRDYKEGSHINEKDRFSQKSVTQCPKQKPFPPVLLAIFIISGERLLLFRVLARP